MDPIPPANCPPPPSTPNWLLSTNDDIGEINALMNLMGTKHMTTEEIALVLTLKALGSRIPSMIASRKQEETYVEFDTRWLKIYPMAYKIILKELLSN